MNDLFKKQHARVIAIVVVLVVLFGASVCIKNAYRPKIDADSYQVVFLSNNLQYFGHLKGLGTRYPSLTDIYYVQNQPLQNGETLQKQKFSLIKMGNEIYGPEDVMYLNWKNIVSWQTLKNDSQVVKGIMQEKAQRAAKDATAVTTPPAK